MSLRLGGTRDSSDHDAPTLQSIPALATSGGHRDGPKGESRLEEAKSQAQGGARRIAETQ